MLPPVDIEKLSADEARGLLEVVDNTIGCLCGCTAIAKAGYPGEGRALPFENALVEILLTKWGSASRQAVDTAIEGLRARTGTLSDTEIADILALIDDKIDSVFVGGVGKKLPGLFGKAYKRGKRDVFANFRIPVAFDVPDTDAIKWLGDHHMYWVGNYYNRHLSTKLSQTVAQGVAEGLGREAVGQRLKSFFADYPGISAKPDSYWRGMSANGMNRARNFGLIEGYENLGVTELRILVVLDERTSDICKAMAGQVIPVSAAINQRDLLMAAEDPEDVKAISPWVSADAVIGKDIADIVAQGVIMPPYHFNCRTTVVAVR